MNTKTTDNNGGKTEYYDTPEGNKTLQDLIEYKEMNFAIGNIFKACYRLGKQEHSKKERDLNKILYFANRELEKLKKVFPEVFNFTGWAKYGKYESNWLGYFQDNILQYGINAGDYWFNIDNGAKYNPAIDRPATYEEIETALVKEAKKRGFVIGCKHSLTNGFKDVIASNERFGLDLKTNKLFFNNCTIFEKGTWAEVKKEPKPKYVLVSEKRYVSFGKKFIGMTI
jgi:hypothetical protein